MKKENTHYRNVDMIKASFIAELDGKRHFIVKKNIIGPSQCYMSIHHVRKTLRNLSKLGHGSSTWLLIKI